MLGTTSGTSWITQKTKTSFSVSSKSHWNQLCFASFWVFAAGMQLMRCKGTLHFVGATDCCPAECNIWTGSLYPVLCSCNRSWSCSWWRTWTCLHLWFRNKSKLSSTNAKKLLGLSVFYPIKFDPLPINLLSCQQWNKNDIWTNTWSVLSNGSGQNRQMATCGSEDSKQNNTSQPTRKRNAKLPLGSVHAPATICPQIVDLTILCNSRKTSLLHYMPFARPKKPHALWVLANENSEHWNDLKMNVILERHLSKCPWEQISLCQSELGSCGKNCCGKDHQIATGQGPVEHHPCASSAHFWKCCPWSHWKGSHEQLGLEIAMSGKVKSMRPLRESRQWFTSAVNL